MEENKEIIETKLNPILKIIIFLGILFLGFYFYIRYGEPNFFTVQEIPIIDQNLPYSFDGLKIVQFSDILYGSTINQNNFSKIIKKVNDLNPDVVIFTGDLFNDSFHVSEKDISYLKENLNNIHAKTKKYAILGDNDYINKDAFLDIFENSGFIILDNKNDFLYYNGNDPLLFIGTSSLIKNDNNINKAIENVSNIDNYYTIWLNHEPTILKELDNKSIKPALIFSGHTLKGLISIPFIGALLKQDEVIDYNNTYYETSTTKMYLSNGLGTYKFNLRFKNLPSISLYRFYTN